MFRIHVIPAQRGDAFWIEYGVADSPNHVLIDGGITKTGKEQLLKMAKSFGAPLHIELIVVTHIDLDHIQGVLSFLKVLPNEVTIGDIWFNGASQLKEIGLEPFGVKEGIELSKLLGDRYKELWNKAANGSPIALSKNGDVISYFLGGGMEVLVLGPTYEQLEKLRQNWSEVIDEYSSKESKEEADESEQNSGDLDLEPMGRIDVDELANKEFKEDSSIPNGSSISLLLKFGEKTLLMLGDAHPTAVLDSLNKISPYSTTFPVDVMKVSHHGSRSNTNIELVQKLSAPTWIFSSNGANNTKHPHKEAVARVIAYSSKNSSLIFNYKTEFNEIWDSEHIKKEKGYKTIYGDGVKPIVVTLI